MTTINEILENPEIAKSLTDAQIRDMAYGIKYFDTYSAYTAWGKEEPKNANETLIFLRQRLVATHSETSTTNHSQPIQHSGTRYDEKCSGCARITDICNDCEMCRGCHA